MNWLQEGDANIKKFHGIMSNCRRQNTINLVSVNGVTVEGVQNIQTVVYNHFSSHFKVVATDRPSVEALPFRKLSYGEAGNLTKPFSLEEVKQAVWDCDSFKSPGPVGIRFDIIKKNWALVQDDFMQFLMDFHRNRICPLTNLEVTISNLFCYQMLTCFFLVKKLYKIKRKKCKDWGTLNLTQVQPKQRYNMIIIIIFFVIKK